jgi:hypothetical protein
MASVQELVLAREKARAAIVGTKEHARLVELRKLRVEGKLDAKGAKEFDDIAKSLYAERNKIQAELSAARKADRVAAEQKLAAEFDKADVESIEKDLAALLKNQKEAKQRIKILRRALNKNAAQAPLDQLLGSMNDEEKAELKKRLAS